MSMRRDLEADVSGGGQEWHEPDSADMAPARLVYVNPEASRADAFKEWRKAFSTEVKGGYYEPLPPPPAAFAKALQDIDRAVEDLKTVDERQAPFRADVLENGL